MVATLDDAHQIIRAQQAQLHTQSAQMATLQEQVATLVQALESAKVTMTRQQEQLNYYIKRVYGRRSERYHEDQLRFDRLLLDSLVPPKAGDDKGGAKDDGPAAPPEPKRKRCTPHGRAPIPEHLERRVVELDIPEAERVCPHTGTPLVCIGHEDSEQLTYIPGNLSVTVYRRYKYAAGDRQLSDVVGIVQAPLPDWPIAKCKADPGLIAYAIVSKYADHLPLYRQDQIFAREGVRIPRSTLDGWVLGAGEALLPLADTLKRAVLDTDVLFTDDTVLPLLEKGRGRTRKARLWVYIRGAPKQPGLRAYDFTVDRRKERPLEYLGGYQGYVHADAYSGYDELFARDGIREVGCWCHARRKFDEAMDSRPSEASEIIALIARLYAGEEALRPLSPADRHQGRQEHVRPVVEAILARVEQLQRQAVPQEPLGKACTYVLNQRAALLCFLEDGRLEADNNTAENAVRPVAVGRKNYLFVGSEGGGQVAALYLGLIESCKACQINPWAYFDDILRRIMSHPVQRLRALLPDQWQPGQRDERGLVVPSP